MHSNVSVWHVLSWEPYFMRIAAFYRMLPALRPLAGSTYKAGSGRAQGGQCLWGTETDGRLMGLAWDWGETVDRTPALSDPMHILTNVHLLDSDGCCLPTEDKLIHLNEAVNRINWQAHLLKDSATGRVSRRRAAVQTGVLAACAT